ncbi:hypothetical protein EVG20_g6680 [Dentipellis fragilis]|uniref:Uncharacterized protein n=1 Tax=Dentipellis fragilis TaxID=205917 RepID=A0A4Y9YNC9_9AGAM|nr:hypothetical protein EVG20_g6680 [Dentipellis fragilis]
MHDDRTDSIFVGEMPGGLAVVHPRMIKTSGIHCLPSEILAKVFVHNAPVPPIWRNVDRYADTHEPITMSSISFTMSNILAITHVCRLWRTIAIGLPRLWDYVTFGKLDLVEAAIARSAPGCSLLLDFGLTRSFPDDVRQHVSDIIRRTAPHMESLSLIAQPPELSQFRQILQRCELPKLSSLRLGIYGASTVVDSNDLNIVAPNLRVFHADRCFVQWTSPIFRAPLTELYVSHLPSSITTDVHILDCLASLPTLVYVSLNHGSSKLGSVFHLNDASLAAERTVHMPRLEYLYYSGILRECTFLLDCIVIPLDALVCVDAEAFTAGDDVHEENWSDDIDHFIHAITTHFGRRTVAVDEKEMLQVPRILSLKNMGNPLRLDLNRWGLDELCGQTIPSQGLHQKQKFGTLFSLNLEFCNEYLINEFVLAEGQDIVQRICSINPTDFDTFLVGHHFSMEIEWHWWMTMSKLLPRINTVVLEDRDEANLLPFLLLLRRDAVSGSLIRPLIPDAPNVFPNLKTLVVASDNIFRQQSSEVYSGLLRGLCWRGEHVEKLRLKVRANNVGDDQLAELQGHVKGDVQWTKDVSNAS